MDNKSTVQFMNQQQTEMFLLTRGGNRGKTFDAWEGFKDVNSNNSNNSNNDVEPSEQFYKGDKILNGNFFKGWNDTYFFQSSLFRENNDFWVNPFKQTSK